jgi:uncharacterized membrane protein YiaA
MRGFYLVLGIVIVLVGTWLVVYPLSSGRGFTVGALIGVVLIAAGALRIQRERRAPVGPH